MRAMPTTVITELEIDTTSVTDFLAVILTKVVDALINIFLSPAPCANSKDKLPPEDVVLVIL